MPLKLPDISEPEFVMGMIMSLSPRAFVRLGHTVGSPCKVWCLLHYLPGLREVCRGWWVERWGVRGGKGPPAQGVPQLGPMGPTRGHRVRACCSFAQDYSAIIELVETLQALPTCDVAEQHNICFHYTFALNR